MTNLTRKIVSVLIVSMVILAEIVTPMTVLANLQNPVTDLIISDFSKAADKDYSLELHWKQPQKSTKADMTAKPPDNTATHNPQGYDIFYRNATEKETYTTASPQKNLAVTDADLNMNVKFDDLSLSSGSLYMFSAVPWHNHLYTNPSNGQSYTYKAPTDSGAAKNAEALYLTDIQVEATGKGKEITVIWDNPTIDGKQVFDGYRIYYSIGGVANATVPQNPHFDLKMDNPNLEVIPQTNKIKYKITDPSLVAGKYYALKVEPMVGQTLARDLNKITFDNKTYGLSYVSKIREYRTNDVYVSPALYVESEGLNKIKLHWDSFATSTEVFEKIEIFKSVTPTFEAQSSVGTIIGPGSKYINFFLEEKPEFTTYYKIKLYTQGRSEPMESNIAVYDPSYASFEPYSPMIIPPILDNKALPLTMDITWKGFTRPAFSPEEQLNIDPRLNKYIDKNIIYDVYITDLLENFENPMIKDNVTASLNAHDLTEDVVFDVDEPMNLSKASLNYSYSFDTYAKLTDKGFVTTPLDENKIYYVKITAKRTGVIESQISAPSYGSHYITPISDIATVPNMMSKPPLKVIGEGEDYINIAWGVKWYEAYNAVDPADNNWYSKIGVKGGDIVFGNGCNDAEFAMDLSDPKLSSLKEEQGAQNIRQALITAGADPTDAQKLPLRVIDSTGTFQKIHVVEYDYLMEQNAYDEYLQMLLLPENLGLWQDITPSGGSLLSPEYQVNEVKTPAPGKLEENTAYVIFFLPYENVSTAYYPSYVTGTTLSKRAPGEITPTTPVLEALAASDTAITLRWESSPELSYELVFSESLGDYPNGGKAITQEELSAFGVKSFEGEKQYTSYELKGLFPNTTHYFWVRASAKNNGNTIYSLWSNPLDEKTLDINPPETIKGLGVASKGSLDVYNKNNDTTYKPTDTGYIIVEWMENYFDANPLTPLDEDNSFDSVGDATLLFDENITATKLEKFDQLTPNENYYFRGKTRLVLSKGKDAALKQTYIYTVQMSRDPEFIDFTEITTPSTEKVTSNEETLTKDSPWSKTVIIQSEKTTAEYDGDKNALFYPLPPKDFQVIPYPHNHSLLYRFRQNGVGEDGLRDNHADLRLISKAQQNRLYTYEIDLRQEDETEGDFATKTIEIPYSVINAFSQRKIDLEITDRDFSLSLPPEALNIAEVKALSFLGKDTIVKITIETAVYYAKSPSHPKDYLAQPIGLSLDIVNGNDVTSIKRLGDDMSLSMSLNGEYSSPMSYVYDPESGAWEFTESKFEPENAISVIKTSKLGGFCVVEG